MMWTLIKLYMFLMYLFTVLCLAVTFKPVFS